MRAKILKASLLAMLLSSTALADTSSMSTTATGMGVLENDYVKAGVNGTAGTLGSGGNTSPGLLYDSTGTGTFNTSYDYLTPGSPFDGFAIKIDGVNTTNNNGGSNSWSDADGLTDGDGTLTWTGTNAAHSGWEIENIYSLGTTSQHIDITTNITAGSAATDVWFSRFIDPDARAAAGDSSATDNVLGYGVIPDSNVAFSEALSSRYALGLYSTDSNVDAGITDWDTWGDAYTDSKYTDAEGNTVNYGTGDDTIGLSWYWSGVSAGDILTANYAYIFGPSAFDAADAAITAGAGGGADTSSWGTLTDIGSATDAATSGGSTPTLVSTVTETITSTSEAVSSTLPVLTAGITHHESSVADGVQTIARETTTTVTTPVEVTTTSFDRTTETYSDSSTVVTDGTATVTTAIRNDVVTTVTDPGSFVGRADQAQQMLGLNVAHGLGFAQGVAGGRTSHSMAHGNSAETTQYGLGHTFVTENGMSITGGLNFANTTMTGTDGTGEMSTTHFGARVGKALDGRDLTIGVEGNIANSSVNYTRTIGDFEAAGETAQSDMWGTLTVEKSTGAVRPWIGYTVGQRSTDGWTETGDIQAQVASLDSEERYNYASIGLNVEAGMFELGFSKAFDADDTTRLSIGIDKNINDKIAIGAGANRTIAGDNESTFLTAGLKISF